MTEREAIDEAKRLAMQYRIRMRGDHPRRRSEERNATSEDVRQALLSCTSGVYQPENDRWLFRGGLDLEGDRLDVVLKFAEGVAWLVTVLGDG